MFSRITSMIHSILVITTMYVCSGYWPRGYKPEGQ